MYSELMSGFADQKNKLIPWEATSEEFSPGCVDSQVDMAILKAFTVLSRLCMSQGYHNNNLIFLEVIFWRKWG